MEQPYNKPRVFLSYSEKDNNFVQSLADDLRKCQIEPWQFTYEVRHGKPWLDSIFRYGLPTCDAIIAYLTESSLSSAVVSKEIDAGILQKLSDNNVAFLPYVNRVEIRKQLRPDIQAIQTPVWNDENYLTLLPIVVSEIWRSYLERIVSSATKEEHLKRVEAELELEKFKNQPDDVFSKSEKKEFEFIWSSFERTIPLAVKWLTYDEKIHGPSMVDYRFRVHLSTLVAFLSDFSALEYKLDSLESGLAAWAGKLVKLDLTGQDLTSPPYVDFPDFTDELLTHGLIEKFAFRSRVPGSEPWEHKLELSKKYFRFRFWLAYHHKLPEGVLIEVVNES